MKTVHLNSGKNLVVTAGFEVVTVLGSCVAVVICDPSREILGVSHYLLPFPPRGSEPSDRYGTCAIPNLIEGVLAAGGQRKDLRACIYGGADIVVALSGGYAPGTENIAIARELVGAEKIRILEENVGGNLGRRISVLSTGFAVKHELVGSEARRRHG